MTVCWDIFSEESPHQDQIDLVWRPFIDHCDQVFERQKLKTQDWDDYLVEQLAVYGSHTDWSSESDPIWFSDAEHLAEFILTWSK